MTEENNCNCGCDDHHHEEHTSDVHCGCGCEDHAEHRHSGVISNNQADFLRQLSQSGALPVARFLVKSSREESFTSVALAPVFLRNPADDMETVKEAGRFLTKLEDMGLLTLDYDIPLKNYPYHEYQAAALYTYFQDTVGAAQGKSGFLGDIADQELGSMALTEAGEQAIRED